MIGKRKLLAATAYLLVPGATAAGAQPKYPSEPIKIVVPRSPGGGSDILARLLAPGLEKKLAEIGWDVPVLEGYRCAIGVAKTLVDLGVDASGLAFPGERPVKWRRRKVF